MICVCDREVTVQRLNEKSGSSLLRFIKTKPTKVATDTTKRKIAFEGISDKLSDSSDGLWGTALSHRSNERLWYVRRLMGTASLTSVKGCEESQYENEGLHVE